MKNNKKLCKSRNRMLFGVCGGVAEYLGIDPTVVRVIVALVTLFTGFFPCVFVYIVAALIMPEYSLDDIDIDSLKRANVDEREEFEQRTKTESNDDFDSYFEKKK